MRSLDLTALTWRKSSYSNSDGGACIEICDEVAGLVPVRDSKDPQGPALVFPAESWAAFVSAVRGGEFAS